MSDINTINVDHLQVNNMSSDASRLLLKIKM
jgi:hypothetical protein